ncbi:hypothetical protein STXM2123_3773 [Streptomyces sp. F-3]|uniref:DUF4190 domain-containing protein n=1 Tax=Streptomyces thermogriseus TaxID=75292 RepID=A0ABP4DJI5_9ACTN|nr:DUF1707 and DUF4190 domain-containing protein [Streptomyces sp. F-3]GAT83072.1 hypothetical protein STXM2123_3773 [Streptomyces sp. F-3]
MSFPPAQPPWQPWQPWQPGQGVPQPWQWQGNPSLLASHADRERAVDVLRAGFGEGRLDQEEFDRRTARAYQARTVGELALLVADLPQGPAPFPAAAQAVPATFLPRPVPPVNSKAVGSLVCGVLTLMTAGLTGLPAVVLGHAARAEIRRRDEGGDALALTGLVLGWLSVAGWALFLVLLVLTTALASG